MVIKGNLIVIGSDEESAPRKCEYCGKINDLFDKAERCKEINVLQGLLILLMRK